jgi:hypothetical protein
MYVKISHVRTFGPTAASGASLNQCFRDNLRPRCQCSDDKQYPTRCNYIQVLIQLRFLCIRYGYEMRINTKSSLYYIIEPGSSVGKATSYGLAGSGIETRCGRDFPHLSKPLLGPTQPPVQWVPGLSRG